MRLIARLPDSKQASFLIDALRNGGFDRKDLVVSNLAQEQEWDNPQEAADNMVYTKTEREGMNDVGTFAAGIHGLEGREGIIVAVEAPKHEASRVRAMMEQSGAIEIIQD